MSDLVKYPGAKRKGKDAMAAVESDYGPAMVEHMRSQGQRVYNECLAEFGDNQYTREDAAELKAKADEWLSRCESDKDYALMQARFVAVNVPRRDWGIVPSVAQHDRDVVTNEAKVQAWYEERGQPYTAKVRPAVTEKAAFEVDGPASPPWAGIGWRKWLDGLKVKAAKELPE